MGIALHYREFHWAQRGSRGKKVDIFVNFDLPVDIPSVQNLKIIKGLNEIKQESFNGGSWWF